MGAQETADLIKSVNDMTATVAGKVGEIDQKVLGAESLISGYISTARNECFYVNMFRNSFAKESNDQGELIFPISTYGKAVTAAVVTWTNIPENVRATVPAKLMTHEGMRPNALHVVFKSDEDSTYWLPGNPVAGRFSGGFAHVYVVSGSMSGYGPNESGPRVQHVDRNSQSWHIDLTYGAIRGTEAYIFAPFVVAGYCHDADLVQYIPTQTSALNYNIS